MEQNKEYWFIKSAEYSRLLEKEKDKTQALEKLIKAYRENAYYRMQNNLKPLWLAIQDAEQEYSNHLKGE